VYVILTYDIADDGRLARVRKYVQTFLPRVQDSVFEGEITESRLDRLRSGVCRRIDADTDSVLVWVLRDAKWVDRQVLGTELRPISNML
jgi:CRISPR-associated protein Cas2